MNIEINLTDIVTTIFSTFVGAWLAYKWAEKTQQGVEKRAQQEEIKKDKKNKTWQLNYLNLFVHTHLVGFIESFRHLKFRDSIITAYLKDGKLSDENSFVILQLVDVSLEFPLDLSNLMFTADDNDFIQGLVLIRTSLNNYYSTIQRFNNLLEPFQKNYSEKTFNKQNMEYLQNLNKSVLIETSCAIRIYYNMLSVVLKYNKEHDKLILNDLKPFDKYQQAIINAAMKIQKGFILELMKQQENIKI